MHSGQTRNLNTLSCPRIVDHISTTQFALINTDISQLTESSSFQFKCKANKWLISCTTWIKKYLFILFFPATIEMVIGTANIRQLYAYMIWESVSYYIRNKIMPIKTEIMKLALLESCSHSCIQLIQWFLPKMSWNSIAQLIAFEDKHIHSFHTKWQMVLTQ